MADMELVIKIPEEEYQNYLNMRPAYPEGVFCYIKAIQKGKLLPKGHGRLLILSEDAVKRELTHLGFSCQSWISDVGLSDATVAIIEADKEEMEGEELIFEVGKTYQHNDGERMTIIGRLKTHIYGECLIGERDTGELIPVGESEANAINWHEQEYLYKAERIDKE